MITLYIYVCHNNAGGWAGDNGILYTKEMETDYLPRRGDSVFLAPAKDPEDGQLGGGEHTVKRIYWGADGSVSVELIMIRVDPTQRMLDTISPRVPRTGYGGPYWTPWWTSSDGPIEPVLERGGWRKY